MLKETGYQEKFEMLSLWMRDIIETVKKDLKNEHLKIDREFCKRYFLGKNYQQVGVEEMAEAYRKDIASGNVGLGEFIASRWLLKNTDIYGYFEEKLKDFTPEFDQLDELSMDVSLSLMKKAITAFGSIKTYLFCVLNSVVFPAEIYKNLESLAISQTNEARQIKQEEESALTFESLRKRFEREMSASTDRYEKKLSGMQKKYLNDTLALKKQISLLQKKLDKHDHVS